MTFPPEQLAAMSAEDRARVAASDSIAAGIERGRRQAAMALLAPPGPLREVALRWAPILGRVAPQRGVIAPPPAPDPITGDQDFFQGEGPPPPAEALPGAGPGDTYLDTLTGDLYELED